MAGFLIVLFIFGIIITGIGVAVFLPLIIGFITIPKDTNMKIKRVLLYTVSILVVQIITIFIVTILAIPYLAFVQGSGYNNLLPLLTFNIIPLTLLIWFSIKTYKWVVKIKNTKKTMIFITIQSFFISVGITFLAIIIADTWLI